MREKIVRAVILLTGVTFLVGGVFSYRPGDSGYSAAGAVLIGSWLIARTIAAKSNE